MAAAAAASAASARFPSKKLLQNGCLVVISTLGAMLLTFFLSGSSNDKRGTAATMFFDSFYRSSQRAPIANPSSSLLKTTIQNQQANDTMKGLPLEYRSDMTLLVHNNDTSSDTSSSINTNSNKLQVSSSNSNITVKQSNSSSSSNNNNNNNNKTMMMTTTTFNTSSTVTKQNNTMTSHTSSKPVGNKNSSLVSLEGIIERPGPGPASHETPSFTNTSLLPTTIQKLNASLPQQNNSQPHERPLENDVSNSQPATKLLRGKGDDQNDKRTNSATNMQSQGIKDATSAGKTACQKIRLCRTPNLVTQSYREQIPYQCMGDKYDAFAKKLSNLTLDKSGSHSLSSESSSSCTWSQRPFPIPNDRTVLVIGNSHTRQVLHALLCQYQDTLVKLHRIPEAEGGYGTSYYARFQNNSTLYGLTNSALVYSRNWEHHLIRALFLKTAASSVISDAGVPTSSSSSSSSINKNDVTLTQLVDAIVVGNFNGVGDSLNTAFYRVMVNLTKSMGMSDVDFKTQPPPTFQDVIRTYSGPVVFMGMFAGDGRYKSTVQAKKIVELQQQSGGGDRNNLQAANEGKHNRLAVVDGRAYVGQLGECATDSQTNAGQYCYDRKDNTNGSRPAIAMHRCNGFGGGLPDLTSWDLVEDLYRLLSGKGNKEG